MHTSGLSAGQNQYPCRLTLYQPMTQICVMSSHELIRIYMGVCINTLYRLFCLFKLFPLVGKGLNKKNIRFLIKNNSTVHQNFVNIMLSNSTPYQPELAYRCQ